MARPISEKAKDRTLGALRMGFSYDRAAKFAGIARRTIFNLKDRDPDFAAACDEAYEAGTDKLEDEARRRAFEGTDRPIFQGGKLVGHERQYSDRLLELQLKARRPDKYREQRITVVHPRDARDGSVPETPPKVIIEGGLPDDTGNEPELPPPDETAKPGDDET